MLSDPRFLKNDYNITYIDKLIADGCNFTEKKE
jgi:hypothetical protein